VANTLRTGLVIAGGYADKVRRVLFAQLRDLLRAGELSNRDVAKAAAELNRLLYEIIVNRLGLDKGDVVRITVDYEVEPPEIKWKLDTLRVEAWRRVPDEEVAKAVEPAVRGADEYMRGEIRLEVERLGETETGDIVYALYFGGRLAGALLVTPLNGKAVVRGAITEPTPMVIRRTIIEYEGDVDEYVRARAGELMSAGSNVEQREAEKIIREIRALLGEE